MRRHRFVNHTFIKCVFLGQLLPHIPPPLRVSEPRLWLQKRAVSFMANMNPGDFFFASISNSICKAQYLAVPINPFLSFSDDTDAVAILARRCDLRYCISCSVNILLSSTCCSRFSARTTILSVSPLLF